MILDCTLRDGGYHTNWEFDDDLVREIVSTLDVDYIELGYKSKSSSGRCDIRNGLRNSIKFNESINII